MQSKTNLFQLMPVMSEILFGKNPSQSFSQTNLPLYTPSAVSCLVCHFFLAKKKTKLEKNLHQYLSFIRKH